MLIDRLMIVAFYALGIGFGFALAGFDVVAMSAVLHEHHTLGGVFAALGGLIFLDGFIILIACALASGMG